MVPFLLKLNFLQSTSRIIVVIAVMLVTSSQIWLQSSSSEIKSNELSSKVGENLIAFAKSFVNISAGKHPCEDFYDFVCRRNVSNLTNDGSGNRHHHVERTIFNKFLQNDNTTNAEKLMDSELKLKNFYVSCREERSVEQLKESTLYKKCGGWPAIASSDSQKQRTNFTWMDVVTEFHVIGIEYFFMHRIEMKSNRRVVELLPNTNQRFTLRKYEQLAEQVLIDYNVDAGRAHLIGLEIVNFERNRRKCLKVNNATRTNTTHDADDENILMEISYQEFKRKVFGASDINWDNYFRKVLGKPPKEADMVRVHSIEQFRNILELLRKTSTNCLLNYLWIEYLMGKSSKDCEMLAKEYFQPVYWQIVANSFTDKLQTAQMFSDIGKSYDPLRLPQTAWIDEMTYENSKQFLGRIIHLTLNGEAKLDEEYASLAVSEGNFYQNLEHCQRFMSERRLRQQSGADESGAGVNKVDSFDSLVKIYFNVLPLLFNTQNPILVPLNFPLVGEHFAEMMIAGGSSETPGSWRSTDSDRSFGFFMQCLQLQQLEQHQQLNSISHWNANNLLLRILAQKQTFMAFAEWQANHKEFVNEIEKNISMSLNRTYFIAATLRDCESDATTTTSDHQRDFVNIYLRNSMDFIETFKCHEGNEMFPQTICLSLEDI